MLSIEDPSPSDPHEKSLEGVDRSNPALDDPNKIPKFSIRDYVFNVRSKDIEKNWPFSQKSLHLCLRNRVNNLLPPFECLDCVKNQSSKKDSVESSLGEEKICQNSVSDPSNSCNDHVNSSLNNKVGNIGCSGFESDKQLPFTANNPPQELFLKKIEKSEPHLPKKLELSKSSSMKKCKLIVKVGTSGADQSSSSYTAPMVEQIASSKVCPVCKTFSSSSNTKLNAHIDQCLSVDSPIKPSSKSKLIKHKIKPKIKPKKTRLMVDIYATALHCTLEELDRRNGRIWIEKPIQKITLDYSEEKKKKDNFEERGDEDVVYIDPNGTKIRILNKISGTSSPSKLEVDPRRLSKSLKGDKGSKALSICKKKQKHQKYFKLASKREKECFYKTRLASRVLDDDEKYLLIKKDSKIDENIDTDIAQSSRAREQIKALDCGTLLPKWASSKRTNLLKRRFEINNSSLRDSYLERSYTQKARVSYASPHLRNFSPKNGKEMGNSSFGKCVNECHEQVPLKKQMGVKSVKAQRSNFVDGTFSSEVANFSASKEQMLSPKKSTYRPKLSKKGQFHGKIFERCEDNETHFEDRGRSEENNTQLPLKRPNLLKIKRKKSPPIISQRNEYTEEHDVVNGFADIGKSQRGNSVIGQSSGTESENFMSLTKSFDQSFYKTADIDTGIEMCTTNEQIKYFSGVDSITIPSPPGSFLPSPGRVSSDEDYNQGNSSLTSNLAQSSIDIVDRDTPNSPKSANSTLSNTLETKSDTKSVENLSSDGIIKLGFSDEITKTTLGFEEDQPCHCSRKEGLSVNSQESQLLKRRVVEKPLTFYPNNNDYTSISRPDMGPISVKVDVNPLLSGDFGSPSCSSPNPVLRLMGKNLVVVNSDENSNQSPNSKFQTGPQDHVYRQVGPFHDYKPIDLDQPTPFSPLRYSKIDRVEATSSAIPKNEESTISKNKEVIIIDDIPETEFQKNISYDPWHLNPIYSNQEYNFSSYRGPHMIPNVSSQMPPPSMVPKGWSNVLEGSRILPASSLTPLSSTSHGPQRYR